MSVLNRDLRKVWLGFRRPWRYTSLAAELATLVFQVIIVDDDPKAFQLQPFNGVRIAPFT